MSGWGGELMTLPMSLYNPKNCVYQSVCSTVWVLGALCVLVLNLTHGQDMASVWGCEVRVCVGLWGGDVGAFVG